MTSPALRTRVLDEPAGTPTAAAELIRSKQFRMALRGYAVEEVDAFLDELAAQLVASSSASTSVGGPQEDGMAQAVRTLRLAEQMADRLAADAEREAAATAAAAKDEAEALLASARAHALQIRDEVTLEQRREVQALERRSTDLRSENERLAELERSAREHLEAVLHEQLRLLGRSSSSGSAVTAA